MSEFGYKIKNYQAGSVYGYNLGVRDKLDVKGAMLTNSLFSEFLISIGMTVNKNGSTRDIICMEFDYGSRSYEDEMKFYEKKLRYLPKNTKLSPEELEERRERLNVLIEKAKLNENKFIKKSRSEIRNEYYNHGVDIPYAVYDKNNEYDHDEYIHYKMLYRTPGKAKKGSCMFIRDELFEKAREFLYMGIQLPEENSPIVEIGAYSSLVTSTIVGTVEIKPEEILLLKDVDAFFETDVISVELDEDGHCQAVKKKDYKVKNTLFDGQALIDTSIFPEWGEGYILLRHHFTKMAAFHSNIQVFFKDYFGDEYEAATVTDMYGKKHLAKDIKLITTDNAIKWTKFGVSYEYWSDWVRVNGCKFGIVKTAHKSKLGDVQRMSYQMVNALDMDIMDDVISYSRDYVHELKANNEVFKQYLLDNGNFSNDFEALAALMDHNKDFVYTDHFRSRKRKIIESYVRQFKNGHIIQNGDNLVIVGSPYAMLLHAVGENPLSDPTFEQENVATQCWTERFKDNEYLAEFRSPFNSQNNLGYLHNHWHHYFDRYFNLGEQIIAINMIGTDFQDKNNGLIKWVSVQKCA